jgi:hypothetical protein
MVTMPERVETLGVTTTTARQLLERLTPVWPHPHTRYRVVLRRVVNGETRKLSIEWRQGLAHTGPPRADDVLDCLASDAAGYLNARNAHEWATEYGYDTDEPKDRSRAERLYFTIGEQTEKLQAFLGDDFDALVWQTERL